jgi:hypothetical protein
MMKSGNRQVARMILGSVSRGGRRFFEVRFMG